jgi:hypothetical protein
MAKGYPNDSPLQTKLAAESSIFHRHIRQHNCGSGPPRPCSTHAHDEFSGAEYRYQLDQKGDEQYSQVIFRIIGFVRHGGPDRDCSAGGRRITLE